MKRCNIPKNSILSVFKTASLLMHRLILPFQRERERERERESERERERHSVNPNLGKELGGSV